MNRKKICVLITTVFMTTTITPAITNTQAQTINSASGTVTSNKIIAKNLYADQSNSDVTPAVDVNDIVVANNVGKPDTVTIKGLKGRDIVRVYNADGTNVIGSSTASRDGDVTVALTSQLSEKILKLNVTVERYKLKESPLTLVTYVNEVVTGIPNTSKIVVNNNVGRADTITFKELKAKDVVKVYAVDGKTLLATGTAIKDGELTINLIKQLDETALKLFVTIKSDNQQDSAQAEVEYLQEAVTDKPNPEYIVVSNNVGKADTITFRGLKEKDVATIYGTDGKTVVGSAVAVRDGDVVITLVKQLDEMERKLFATIKNDNKRESEQAEINYKEEIRTEKLNPENIEVTNNVKKADIVTVKGLKAKDIVTIYAIDGKTILGIGTATKDGDVIITLAKQLDEEALKLLLTLKSDNQRESLPVEKEYSVESSSPKPNIGSITVTNNVGKSDIIVVKGVSAKDIVTVYGPDGKTVLGTATAAKDGDVTVVLNKQLDDVDLRAFVTIKSDNRKESIPTEVTYVGEAITSKLSPANIVVTNNVSKQDTVVVKGIKAKEIVKVYGADGKTVLGTLTAAKDGDVTVVLGKQLDTTELKAYVTVKSENKRESEQVEIIYAAEVVSVKPNVETMVVTNNVGKQDTILIKGLKVKDIVTVYGPDGKTILGTTTVSKAGDITVVLGKQLDETELKAFVTVKSENQRESEQVEVKYGAEVVTPKPNVANIVVTNNVGKQDIVTVKGLKAKDVVKVYGSDGKAVLGTITAVKDGDVAVILGKQLDGEQLKAFVTVKSDNKRESEQVEITYASELVTSKPDVSNMVVTNNVGKADTVTVKGVKAKDVVTIYDADGETVLGTATAAKAGELVVSLKKQLDEEELKAFVTVRNDNKRESEKVEVTYAEEVVSSKLNPEKVIVENNVGKPDTVIVDGVKAKDVVTVYALDGKTVLGTAVAAKDGELTVTLKKQLDETTLKVFVTVKNDNRRESPQVEVSYKNEEVTAKLNETRILVAGNAVIVANVAEGNQVTVYDTNGKTVLGTAKVAKGDSYVVVKLKYSNPTMYVTNKEDNKRESDKLLIKMN